MSLSTTRLVGISLRFCAGNYAAQNDTTKSHLLWIESQDRAAPRRRATSTPIDASSLYFTGWAIAFASSFVIDHLERFGLKQVCHHFRDRKPIVAPFSERLIYRWVRHPLMLGFIVAFWSAPTMSQGRLLFAVVTTLWILVAIRIEERDLVRYLGEPYRHYRERTPMLLPSFRSRKHD